MNNEPRNGLHGTGPLNLHSPATFLSTKLIYRFARIETDVEVFATLARLLVLPALFHSTVHWRVLLTQSI